MWQPKRRSDSDILASIESKLEKMESKIDKMESRFEKMESKFDKTENTSPKNNRTPEEHLGILEEGVGYSRTNDEPSRILEESVGNSGKETTDIRSDVYEGSFTSLEGKMKLNTEKSKRLQENIEGVLELIKRDTMAIIGPRLFAKHLASAAPVMEGTDSHMEESALQDKNSAQPNTNANIDGPATLRDTAMSPKRRRVSKRSVSNSDHTQVSKREKRLSH